MSVVWYRRAAGDAWRWVLSSCFNKYFSVDKALMFRAGQQIGIYTLINRIGRGGFGEVWLAERRAKFVTTKVAVKLPHDEQVDHEAIKQEATLWEQASGHPNILPLIDADEYDGQIVIVSEYAPDGSLDQWLKQHGNMPIEKAIETTIQILDGLEFLHSRNIIHRDLKPANILLQGKTPRLADFGISRALRATMTSQSQHISGTFAYMSPEALDGRRSVQTDIWSVGVNLYQFLTGTLPFPQKEPSVLISAINMREPEPLPDFVPPELKRIVARALAKSPENRYNAAGEMREDLRRVLQGNVQPTPRVDSPQIPLTKPAPKTVKPVSAISQPRIPKIGIPVRISETETVVRPAPSQAKPKTNKLLFVVPAAVLLLLAVIGIGYMLSRISSNEKDMTLIPYRKGDKFGFSDVNKNIVIEPKYDDAQPFSEGLASVALGDKWGLIDKTGREITPFKYDQIELFGAWAPWGKGEDLPNEKLALFRLNGRWGFIDITGKEAILPKYDFLDQFSEGLAKATINFKFGYIDRKGKEIIPLIYEYDVLVKSPFSEGLANVKRNGKWGFINKTGEEVIPFIYDEARPFREGLAGAKLNGKYGFIDKMGNKVIPFIYDDVGIFSEGLASVVVGTGFSTKDGFIDKTGKEIIPPMYGRGGLSPPPSFKEGLADVLLNGKQGYIDKTGKEVISFKYDVAFEFNYGLAYVQLNGKWGFVDRTGKEVIPIKYDMARLFPNGLVKVWLNIKEKPFYVSESGTQYYEP